MTSLQTYIDWLNELSKRGGKSTATINNIDARALGNIAKRLEKMRKALEPFAAKVFNDNGDVTFDLTNEPSTEEYWHAYCALRDYHDG